MESFIRPLIPSIILLLLIFLPVTVVVVTVLAQKGMDKRSARRSPLKDKLLHQAGAQARKRVDELTDGIQERLVQIMLVGPLLMLLILLPRVNWSRIRIGWLEWLLAAAAMVWIVGLTRRIVRLRKERLDWQDGMRAEIAAAQELDRLREFELAVFHDLPAGKDFNIDHVVVGSSAVFMVETKSRRKSGEGKASANVDYDGSRLRFPTWVETKPLKQARAQAQWLFEFLRGETGEVIPVIPVVCLPGWFVQASKESFASDVRVINPKMTSLFIDSGSRLKLQPAQRIRITNALQKRYPDIDD